MFTGIVQGTARIADAKKRAGLLSLTVDFPESSLQGLQIGASISLDGVCLTVTGFANSFLTFDIMGESLNRTTLGTKQPGDFMNFERSLKFGDEVGGHILSGHVDGTCEIQKISEPENNVVFTFAFNPNYSKYIFPKGYVALNGTSLTVSDVSSETNTFDVWFIPETLKVTTFNSYTVGGKVNLEIDRQTQAIVDTVERVLAAQKSAA